MTQALHTSAAYIARTWRGVFARLPLPMLALAASYGVYSFASLFVPFWVAVVQAAAFELTYIGLAVVQGLDGAGRRRATLISVGAVVASVAYNTLAGLFHRNPAWLQALPWYAEVALAVLHGAPLAWVAYLVADLLLHTSAPATPPALAHARIDADIPPQPVYAAPAPVYAAQQAPAGNVRSDADTLRTLLADTPAGAQAPICICGCDEPLSASEIRGRRRTKRGHREGA